MDPELCNACMAGDVPAFIHLVQQDEHLLRQTTPEAQYTVLHLASSLGHTELVREMLRLDPGMVWAKNKDMQTPVYEACRQGHIDVLRALLETDGQASAAVLELDHDGTSGLYAASWNGHLKIVEFLVANFRSVLDLEANTSSTSLHVAAS